MINRETIFLLNKKMPKTELQPKDLFELRNTSDVFNRLVILGMLRILNRRLVYDNIWNKDTI